tara:strand:- start:518 stop:1048 length:531 start_codon:yes stop_codon:yes gene_type:complete
MNSLYYWGTAIAIVGGLYYFKTDIIDSILLYKAIRNEKNEKNDNISIKLYDSNNTYITYTKKLETFKEYKDRYPNMKYVEIDYTHTKKNYSVIFDKDFQFPLEIENEVKGYKKEFLSCVSNDVDVTVRLNKLLGPNRDFYKSYDIKIPVKYILDKDINCIDNQLNEYTLTVNDILH